MLMDALGNILVLAGLCAFLLGAAVIIWPIASLGLSRRRDGLLVIVAAFALVFLGQQVSPTLKQKADERAVAQAPAPEPASVGNTQAERPLSQEEAMRNVTIGSFYWDKDGFGTIMKATFVIHNRNKFPVKDVQVTCTHAANSGTKIDSNTRTVYERISSDGSKAIIGFNMGFIHTAATASKCAVTGFARA
jgi:hypothetical protein